MHNFIYNYLAVINKGQSYIKNMFCIQHLYFLHVNLIYCLNLFYTLNNSYIERERDTHTHDYMSNDSYKYMNQITTLS